METTEYFDHMQPIKHPELTLPALKYGDSTIHPAEPTSSNACAVLPCCPGAFTAQS